MSAQGKGEKKIHEREDAHCKSNSHVIPKLSVDEQRLVDLISIIVIENTLKQASHEKSDQIHPFQ